jgi:hypothetical protein
MWSYFIRNALLLVERGFYNLLEGFNHHIGLVMEKNPILTPRFLSMNHTFLKQRNVKE